MGDFRVWIEGDEDGYSGKITAGDDQSAAEKFAEWYDARTADYTFAKGSDEVVCVECDDAPGDVRRFTITSETVPTYYARTVRGGARG